MKQNTSIGSLVGNFDAPSTSEPPQPSALRVTNFDRPTVHSTSPRSTEPGRDRLLARRKGRELVAVSAYVSIDAKKSLDQLALGHGMERQEVIEAAILEYAVAHPVTPEQLLAALGVG